MISNLRIATILITALLVSSSAFATPKFKEIKSNIPVLESTKARIYFYRAPKYGALSHPDLFLNHIKIWATDSGAVTFIDVVPSLELVEVDGNSVSFKTYAGETLYVNLGSRRGVISGTFSPQLIAAKYGEIHIQELDFEKPDTSK